MPDKWTNEEEKEFLKGVAEKKSFDYLALKHKRSKSALELRLKKIIYENIKNKQTNEIELSKLLKMDLEKIKQYNYEYKGFIEKKLEKNEESRNLIKLEIPTKKLDIENKNIKGVTTDIQKGGKNDKYKINRIKRDNKIMRELIENIKLQKRISEMIKKGIISEKYKKFIKKKKN